VAETPNVFSINSGATYTNSSTITLNISCPTDAGVGGEQIAYDTSANPDTNRTGCTANKTFTIDP
jgi:hypothetical protein